MAARGDRRKGSPRVFSLFLAAGAAVGAAITAQFVASAAGTCSGGDAVGNCIVQNVAAPALTRFALVLTCFHAIGHLLVDVVPDIRGKLDAGYRLRREPKACAAVPGVAGAPVGPLAAACWVPVQAPAVPAPRRASSASTRAVCPTCVTLVTAEAGRCTHCDGPVVARRG